MAISRVIEVSFGRSSVALVRIDTAYFYNNGIIFKPTDIELPTSYQVHWADSPDKATTLETIGTAEGAPIPDDLWNRSRVIYGWIYLHPTEDSSVTGYEVRIYKNVRAGLPDGTEPTPAEQSTIDQLIGALNSAVEQAEDAEERIENMSVSATTLAEGASATVTKSEQDGVVHLAFGIPKGATGDDGYSPTANVSKTGKVATITITDKNGTTSAQVEDGEDGIDGISPSVSVTDITGGHRVVITDKDGAKSFDVEDGATGATPNLTIGTVTTLEPDASATATITGTAEDPVLNLGIPRGQTGEVTEEEFTQLKEDLIATNAEVTDIRVGADGTTYNSAGAAVRGQITDENSFATYTSTYISDNESIFELGNINVVNGENYDSSSVFRSKSVLDESVCKIAFPNGYHVRVLLYDDNGYVGVWKDGEITQTTVWITEGFNIFDLQGEYKIRLIFGKSGTDVITQNDLNNLFVYNSIAQKLPNNSVNTKSLDNLINRNIVQGKYEDQSITWGTDNKYINPNTGVISDAGSINVHVSDYIDISSVPYIRLTASPYYSFCCLAFYDANKTFLRAYPSVSSNVNYWMEEIEVPSAAKYAVFGNNSAISGKLKVKVEFMSSYASAITRRWIGKKWACVGDSLTEINDRASMRYMDYIQIATGIKPINMGKSSTGYANRHAQSESFYDRISAVPTDSDVVTIFGSFNDVFSSSPLEIGTITDTVTDNTLCGFINGTIDLLYTTYPQAQLGIITPCPWENANPSDTTSRASQYAQAIVDICKYRGIPCLDLFHCSGMRPWESTYRSLFYTGDDGGGVHPDANGHKILASHIRAFLDTLLI